MANEEYTAQGPGSVLLPYPALSFLLTTEPFLGTAEEGVPNGPFNREMHKLLQNTSTLADLHLLALKARLSNSLDPVPATTAPLATIPDGPTDPVDRQLHRVWYAEHRVTYMFDELTGMWIELDREEVLRNDTRVITKKIVTALVLNQETVEVVLPASEDAFESFTYTIDDIKSVMVENLDQTKTLISVLPGYWPITPASPTAVKFKLSSAVGVVDKYNFVIIFERVKTGLYGY